MDGNQHYAIERGTKRSVDPYRYIARSMLNLALKDLRGSTRWAQNSPQKIEQDAVRFFTDESRAEYLDAVCDLAGVDPARVRNKALQIIQGR
ncbi:hypothetical protein [Spirochaeta africana]|uniref:Uncharacterized protein n=1 Tax=Spirochaeta africana (strain ATCC 700263 / DSM 8902 / Z-7692) TaxID=889378 RepID=H9UJF1_SPIAZ|nr:hypothetical protein [Spirochaeta africana]AFG37644.1 hypothetical protein Spiaf_1585 [Spirochaeta africana DSM 8902]